MLVDEIILASRKLRSLIEKLEPKFLDVLQPNAIRSKESLSETINNLVYLNIDSLVFIIRYYNTLSIDYRDILVRSLSIVIQLDNTSSIELIDYSKLSDSDKTIFEIIYTLGILEGSTEVK